MTFADGERILLVDFAGHPFQAELARALAARGFEVIHASAADLSGPKGALQRKSDDPPSLSFIELGSARHWRGRLSGRLVVGLRFGAALRAQVRGFNPDVVLVANVPPEALFVAGFGKLSTRWIWWVQDLLAPGARRVLRTRSRLLAWAVGATFSQLERRLARRASSVVVIAESFKTYLPASAHAKTAVLHNWAPLSELPTVPKGNAWAVEFGLAETFNFIYTGTLGMKHNPRLLLHLAEGMAARPDIRVVVASEGRGADYLRAEAKTRSLTGLVVLPFQPYDRLPEVMGTADVLLALLNREAGVFSVPSKILSYLCAGRPILGSIPSANLAAQILTEAHAGVVVAPEDEGAFLAQARVLAAGEPANLTAMGLAARRFAEENFDIEAIVARFTEILGLGSHTQPHT